MARKPSYEELEQRIKTLEEQARNVELSGKLLQQSEARYRRIAETASEGIWIIDKYGQTAFANQHMADMLGGKIENVIGRPAENFIFDDELDAYKERMALRRIGQSQVYEGRFRKLDGNELWVIISGIALIDERGDYDGSLAMVTDITGRRQIEKAFRESERRYKSLFEHMQNAMIYGKILFRNGQPDDFVYLAVNPSFEKITGLKDVVGKKASDVIPQIRKTDPEMFEIGARVVSTGVAENFEIFIESMQMWCSASVYSPRKDHFVAIFDVVTERKQAEQEREGMIKLLQIMNLHGDLEHLIKDMVVFLQQWSGCEAVGIRLREGMDFPYYFTRGFPEDFVEAERCLCTKDLNGQILMDDIGNPVMECMCGNIICGRFDPSLPFFTPHGSFWSSCTTELLASTSEEERQARTRNRCNAEGYESVALIPLRIGEETFGLIQFNDRRRDRFSKSFIEQIERMADSIAIGLAHRKTRKALMHSEEYYRTILQTAMDGVWQTDMQGCLLEVNDAYCRMSGYGKEELLAMRISDLEVIESHGETAMDPQRIVTLGQDRFESRHRRKDGSLFHVAVSVQHQPEAGGRMTAFLRDITDQKHAEMSLRDSEEKFSRAFHKAPMLMTISSIEDGTYIDVNEAYTEVSGFEREEAIGRTAVELGWLNAADYDQLMSEMESKGHVDGMTLELSAKDGRKVYCIYHSERIVIRGKQRLLSIAQDITRQRQAEQDRHYLQERLQRAEKMEALGQLAGGVAHDLNNVLGVTSIFSELLQESIPEDDPMRPAVDNILSSTQKAANIIQDLLTLARRNVVTENVLNLNDVLAGFTNSPEFRKMKEGSPEVAVRIECEKNLMRIKGSPIHLEKTVMNLLSNAIEAIPGKGEVMIRTENRYLDRPVRGYDEAREGDYVVLTVADTGMGIPDEHIGNIFEPFYTKKKMGRSGTGLGLAIVWGTVKDHHGYIDVQSETGKGTTFILYFPATREPLPEEAAKATIKQYMGHGESILVVDDVEGQRQVAETILIRLGYNVHTVASGEEAVDYLRTHKTDLLILDMIMDTGIDGLETYRRIAEISPGQKAIIVSGFAETERVKEAQRLGAGTYIRKPYLRETIGIAVRDTLQQQVPR